MMQPLLTRDQIAERVAEMGAEITRDFSGESVILIGVLKGASIFLGDLARQIKLHATFDFVAVSSYGSAQHSSGEVRLVKDVSTPLEDRNVIVVEDILDTGLTLKFLKQLFSARKPRTLKTAALLDKTSKRAVPVEGDYIGFRIPDKFVVGYGLDYDEQYRNLPDICVLGNGTLK